MRPSLVRTASDTSTASSPIGGVRSLPIVTFFFFTAVPSSAAMVFARNCRPCVERRNFRKPTMSAIVVFAAAASATSELMKTSCEEPYGLFSSNSREYAAT